MEKIKSRLKRKAPDDYERSSTKRTRQVSSSITNRGTISGKDVGSRIGGRDGSGLLKSSSISNDSSRNDTPRSSHGYKTGSRGNIFKPQASGGKDPGQRMDSSRLDSRILELVGNNNANLFKLVYNISIGYFDPVRCVDVIRFYLSTHREGDGKNHLKKSDNGNVMAGREDESKGSDKDTSNSSNGRSNSEGKDIDVGGGAMLIYKLLDLVSFFLDVSKKRNNLLYFLQTLESLGVNKEIISVVDATKLDNCNYSEGLVKISIRERTRNNYVLKVYNLYRETPKGFLVLLNYLSSVTRDASIASLVARSSGSHSSNRRGTVAADGGGEGWVGVESSTVADAVKRITGLYKLCPLRVLYELLNWLVLNHFTDEFVLGLLSMYKVKQIRFCVLFYLQEINNTNTTNDNKGTVELKGDLKVDAKSVDVTKGDGIKGDVSTKGDKKSGGSSISKVVGEGKGDNNEDTESTPTNNNNIGSFNSSSPGIYHVVGLLVSNNYLKLEDIYNYLNPPDSYIRQLSTHFVTTVKSGSSGSGLNTGSDCYGTDNVVLSDLMKSASFYTISYGYLHGYVPPNDNRAKRVCQLVNLFSKHTYGGFSASPVNSNNSVGSSKEEGPFSPTASGGNTSTIGTNTLLEMTNYHLLKNCVYSYNFPKVALLSNLLRTCDDLSGRIWDLSYSLIVHLFKQGYYVFFNTSLVHRFHSIVGKVLAGSRFYGLAFHSYETDENDLVKESSELVKKGRVTGSVNWDVEWVVLSKLEYYFTFVGYRASEDIVLFNKVLSYLYHLLQQLGNGGSTNRSISGDRVSRLKVKVTKIIYKYVLFNIMNCCEGNFQVSDKIWSILKLFTTLERYQIYSKSYEVLTKYKPSTESEFNLDKTNINEVMKRMYYETQLHFVRKIHQIYNYKLKNIFKKITCELLKSVKSPTIRSIVSIITAISAINPFSVVNLIIKQSEMFNNLLLPLCELTKYFQSYTIDVFMYQLTVNLLSLIGAASGLTGLNSGRGSDSGSLSDMRLDCNNLIKEDDNNKISVNSIILCKIFKRHNECDIAPLMTVLVLLLNYSLSSQLTIKQACPGTNFLSCFSSLNDNSSVPDGSGGATGTSPGKKSTGKGLKKTVTSITPSDAHMVKQVDILLESNNYYDVVHTIFKVLDYLINLFELINGIIIIDMNKMTNDQLLSQCGSFSLKTESLLMNLDDEVNLSNKKVFKIVSRPFFLYSLFMILGRLHNELVYDSYFTNYKLLVEVASKFHSVIMLLVEFLSTSSTEMGSTVGVSKGTDEGSSKSTGDNSAKHVLESLSKYYSRNYLDFFSQYLLHNCSSVVAINTGNGGKRGKPDSKSRLEDGEEEILDEKFVEFVRKLNIYDIYVPVEQYDNYINKLVNHYNLLSRGSDGTSLEGLHSSHLGGSNHSSSLHSSTSPINPTLRSVNSAGGRSANGTLGRKLKRIKNRIAALTTDKQSHMAHNRVLLEKLKEISQNFIKNEQKVGPHVTIAFISKIIYPRVFISELNSMFCCKLVDLMMIHRVNYFNYFDFVNCYCKLLVPLINHSTESEVTNFSLFFNYSFNLIKNWINSKETFEKLVVDNPCFCLTFRFNPEKQFKYQQLLQVLKKWEYLILVSLFSCATTISTSAITSIDTVKSEKLGGSDRGLGGEGSVESVDEGSSDNEGNDNVVKEDLNRSATDTPTDNTNPAESGGNDGTTYSPINTTSTVNRNVDGVNGVEPVGRVNSWIEIKNVVIFLNKVSANFPVSYNSSVKVVNFLKNILKLSKKENWQDVTVCTNTLIKTMQMYQNQNRYITLS